MAVWTLTGCALANANETVVAPSDPMLTDPDVEFWFDTSTTPGTLRVNVGGTWVTVGADEREVSVDAVDPLSVDPTAPVDLWYDTTDSPGTLFANVAGTWEQVTQREVFVDDEDPLTRPSPSPEAELWYDISTPGAHVLKANVNGVWEVVTGQSTTVVPDEVLVSPDAPRDQQTELWYDTNATPSTTRSLELLDSVLNEIGLLRQSISAQESRLTVLETYVRNR
jgi:hypothetical protein